MSKENNIQKLREEHAKQKEEITALKEKLADTESREKIAIDAYSEIAGATSEYYKSILKLLSELDDFARGQRKTINALRAIVPRKPRR